ncbi:MAG: glycoside hydrolase family 3 protein [Elusimicrobium sp.]|jgi:beta-N-acetylhexosaminidase|nr:glycoside hydrolase family 3 protein [Elusimicrobium sp.]
MRKLFFVLFFFPLFVSAQVVDFDKLTPEQKLGQTLVIFVDVSNADKYKNVIEKGLVGGVLIQWGDYSLEQTTALTAKLQSWAANSPSRIPLFISIDYEGGTVYTPVTLGFQYLPTNMMIAAANDEDAAARLFYLAGLQLKRAGVHMDFSPVLDVNINPGNPIIGVRSFGSDNELVGRMGAAVISGLNAAGIISVAKHFPGHGNTLLDTHYDLPVLDISKEEVERVHLAPFKKAIEAGVPGIMTAHIIYKAYDPLRPATYSKKILNDLLRKEMGFDGLIISDALDMAGAAEEGGGIALNAARTIEAGSDIALLGGFLNAQDIFNQILALTGKEVSSARIDEAAKKVFDLKKKTGLFETPEETEDVSEAFNKASEIIAQKSVTVLRNNKNIIPLKQETGKLCAVFFAPTRFADEITSFTQPFLEKGWDVNYYNAAMVPSSKDLKRAQACAAGADALVIATLQWTSKPFARQTAAVNALLAKYPDAAVISMMSPYEVTSYPKANTVILTYGINKFSIKTAAEILLGGREAEGKLPIELK